MKPVRITVLYLLLTALLGAHPAQLKSKRITIQYPPGYRQLAIFTLHTVADRLPELEYLFSPANDTLRFILADDAAAFEKYTGARMPHWTSAVTRFPQKTVIIKTPDLAHQSLREYEKTILHELVHLVQGLSVPLNLTPLWFNEGLAMYYSDRYNLRSRLTLSRAVSRQNIIPLAEINRIFGYGHIKAELAYAESASAVEYLVLVYGEEVIPAILNNMKMGDDFFGSLGEILGINSEDFPLHWHKYITDRYRWLFLMDIQHLIWIIFIPVLAILAFVSKLFRNKRTIRQWNQEDRNEATDEDDNPDNPLFNPPRSADK